ncbi:hypothetical protein HIR68_06620 [Staphylococcus coagulans]|uniref:hypothetical protein n=1 Tax=Staphylococcus coagulans TaxID=74706 RepID=UPI0011874D3C|nr:hypothetical protein [Staphylococcus coagulans]
MLIDSDSLIARLNELRSDTLVDSLNCSVDLSSRFVDIAVDCESEADVLVELLLIARIDALVKREADNDC